MKQDRLISMVEFVKWCSENTVVTDPFVVEFVILQKIVKYANFLSRPLELWMFVPCDEEGNVLEEPTDKKLNDLAGYFATHKEQEEAEDWIGQYQKAKDRVLFDKKSVLPYNLADMINEELTIESLVEFEIYLTKEI